MDKLKAVIQTKPSWIVFLIFTYIVILGVLKWRTTSDVTTVYYLVGGLIGVYFMDIAALLFDVSPSPFKSIIFVILFGAVSFFVVTSSGSMFARGMVLSVYLSLLLSQAEDWQEYHNLDSWYVLLKNPPTLRIQQLIVMGTALLLILETLIFIQ